MLVEQGMKIALVPTDPWDLVTAIGSGPFTGIVMRVNQMDYKSIIVRLDKPISYRTIEVEFLVASTRHVGETFRNRDENTLFCNLISLTDKEAHSDIFRPSMGGADRLGFIGDVSWSNGKRVVMPN